MPVVFYVKTPIVIPAGAIVPLRGAGSVPTGWTLHAASDNRMIIGAGSTYSPEASGGTNTVPLSVISPPAHTVANNGFRGGSGTGAGPNADGIHYHTGSTLSAVPPYQATRLISLDSDTATLPENCCFLRHATDTPAGMTRYDGNGLYYRSEQSGDASGGSTSPAAALVSDGIHDHGNDTGGSTGGSDGSNWKGAYPPSHLHNATFSVSFDLYRYALDSWYSASGDVNISNFTNPIIMFNSVTPPSGWALCDGNNGTPDMRDRFLQVTDSAGSPASAGDGTISDSVTSTSAGDHDHDNGSQCNDCNREGRHHATVGGAHTHTVYFDLTWLPPYFSLAFMMKS